MKPLSSTQLITFPLTLVISQMFVFHWKHEKSRQNVLVIQLSEGVLGVFRGIGDFRVSEEGYKSFW
jgi:hypothetical protein